jgi:hypothetical protein
MRVLHIILSVIAIAATACGGGAAGETASASGSASASGIAACDPAASTAEQELTVALDEWSIEAASESAPAGATTIVADNVGEEPHEIVVVRGDDPGALPTDEAGALDEDALSDGALLGEIEPFDAGTKCPGNFELEAGSYVLLCNIVEEEDGQTESHLAEGMVTTLTVTS